MFCNVTAFMLLQSFTQFEGIRLDGAPTVAILTTDVFAASETLSQDENQAITVGQSTIIHIPAVVS